MIAGAFHFGQPVWLLTGILAVPLVYLAWRNLAALGRARQVTAAVCRTVVVLLLAALLARPMLMRTHKELTVVAILDRSHSVPQRLQESAETLLAEGAAKIGQGDKLAVLYAGARTGIARMPSVDSKLKLAQTLGLPRTQTNLAKAVELAMAIAPADRALRIVLASDFNETTGDLRAVAATAAANKVPIDTIGLHYHYDREVVFKRLAAPRKARSGQTISLRFVLESTAPARGRLVLSQNGEPVVLDPQTGATGVEMTLSPGTNVRTISLPVGSRAMHEFEATWIAEPGQDRLAQNNVAGAITFVAGPGHVLLVAPDETRAAPIANALRTAKIDTRLIPAWQLPDQLHALLPTDAIVLIDTPASELSLTQQEMLVRYVQDLGRGLVMVGGPESFGAGGWIGSPVAEVLPVNLDPPQKKRMPKGALVLIMHACEMPRGNYWGKKTAIAAIKSLTRLDLAGVLDYSWNAPTTQGWVYPLSPVGDKSAAIAAVSKMQMGDMPDFRVPMNKAYKALKSVTAGQKHIIIISDGDPQPPSAALLAKMKAARITCSTVTVFPHGGKAPPTMKMIARATGGTAYFPTKAATLPKIFIKEAQLVRRSLIVEGKSIAPKVADSLSELIRGTRGLPPLTGYVLTAPKGGLARVVLTAGAENDPILAHGPSGLGRCVAFTSAADSRWGASWLGWGGFEAFWEKVVRWAARPSEQADCEIFADVTGRQVTFTAEAIDPEGRFEQFHKLAGQVIAPDMSKTDLTWTQVGPGRFQAVHQVGRSGSYMANVAYTLAGRDGNAKSGMTQTVVTVPFAREYRDLADNPALGTYVAQTTGGRTLSVEGGQDIDLFDRQGVSFPVSSTPLTRTLLIVWLAAFLLDVATRRVALDLRAMWAWAANLFKPRRRAAETQQVLAQLRTKRAEVRERFDETAGEATETIQAARKTARRRYVGGGEGPTQVDLPMADTATSGEPRAREPAEPAAAGEEKADSLNRLLRAKRAARGRMRDRNETDNGAS